MGVEYSVGIFFVCYIAAENYVHFIAANRFYYGGAYRVMYSVFGRLEEELNEIEKLIEAKKQLPPEYVGFKLVYEETLSGNVVQLKLILFVPLGRIYTVFFMRQKRQRNAFGLPHSGVRISSVAVGRLFACYN